MHQRASCTRFRCWINAAIDAVRQWVYEPTLLNGMPIAVTLNVTINFTLQ